MCETISSRDSVFSQLAQSDHQAIIMIISVKYRTAYITNRMSDWGFSLIRTPLIRRIGKIYELKWYDSPIPQEYKKHRKEDRNYLIVP